MRRLLVPLVALLLLVVAPAALADRAAAEFFAGRGDKAVQAKDWPGAEEQYRRALTEDAAFHPARFGLAQALLGAGKTGPGIEELRKFSGDVRADPATPAEWKALLAKADKQLQDLDAAGAELRKIVDRYADDLVALAKKWAPKDPATADRAARRVLELRPGDKEAVAVIEKLGGTAKGPPIPLFNGRNLEGWDAPNGVVWTAEEGQIQGNAREGAFILRHGREFTGDYDVKVEARFIEERSGDPMMGTLAALHGPYDHYFHGILNRKILFFDEVKDGERRDIVSTRLSEMKNPPDPMAWNVWEMRFRKDEVTVLVNGEVLGVDKRTERRASGFVGLYIQDGRAVFRSVEVQPR